MTALEQLEAEAKETIAGASDLKALDDVRVSLLGKKGTITEQLKALGQASIEEKKTKGKALNQLKQALVLSIEERHAELHRASINQRLETERVDVSLPAREQVKGSIHPITQVMEEMTTIFADLGFSVAEGPDIEDDFHNFTALNIPPSHPARQMHDTFYLQGKDEKGDPKVLRTHTSPVQIRTMLEQEPPIRIIAPGATYRCDSDMTHTPMFHQVEGLVIDKNIHFGHLKGILRQFVEAFFGKENVPMRFRPSFFPFTEPSAEVDIGCKKGREELVIGEGDDWLEILGCGMVHPNVLRNCNLDPEEWQGFAFGMGVERLAMLKYNIPDLRTFFDSDQRWLSHYGFDALDIPSLVKGI
ncbi:MAG: phenylalanine--tRNA ligase subunit alpha [Rickettsiales bacterium]|nr:phenylalanine--tRNA ligase subunit alpha [Rickettsiales bacterium]